MAMSKEAVDRFHAAWIEDDGVRERFHADPGAVLREFGLSARPADGALTDEELESVSAGTLPPYSMFSFLSQSEYMHVLHDQNGGPIAGDGTLHTLLTT